MRFKPAFLALIAISILSLSIWAQQDASSWRPVETSFGRSGKLQPDGAFKFSMPRKDLNVTVAGTPIKAGLALGSWVAFKGNGTPQPRAERIPSRHVHAHQRTRQRH